MPPSISFQGRQPILGALSAAHSVARKSRIDPALNFWRVIVTGEKSSYYIRMVGPDKTMKKLKDDSDAMVKTIKLWRRSLMSRP